MIADSGIVREDVSRGQFHLSHSERFIQLATAEILDQDWRKGRELLLTPVSPAAHIPTNSEHRSSLRLPRTPRPGIQLRLWIPLADETDPVTGPVYEVAVNTGTSLDRVRADSPVHFVPGMVVVLGQKRRRVLACLDGLDASSLHQLERAIRRGTHAGALMETVDPPATDDVTPGGSGPGGSESGVLPPAAQTILRTIRNAKPGTLHVGPYEKRGAQGLISLLLETGAIKVLDSGLLVSRETYFGLLEALRAKDEMADARACAELWQISVGMARSLLKEYLSEGLLDRQPGGIYKVVEDEQQ